MATVYDDNMDATPATARWRHPDALFKTRRLSMDGNKEIK